MIKINLATGQHPVGSSEGGRGGGSNAGFTKSLFKSITSNDVKSAISDMNTAPLRKLLVPVIVGLIANYLLEDYKKTQLDAIAVEVTKIQVEKTALDAKLKSKTGYDEKKKSLDGDELLVKTKLDTIKQLVDGRSSTVQILLTLSNAMPQDVWLSDFSTKENIITIRGTAVDIGQISDFIKNLNQSTIFQNIELKASTSTKDILTGGEVAVFELSGSRRRE